MTRSEQMARIRSRDTQPEVSLRKALWARGLRYRVHGRLPGRPDLVFGRNRVAVFVDGCFWHGCDEHYAAPAANSGYWREKLVRNQQRDRRVDAELTKQGWTVVRIWEHSVRDDLDEAVERVAAALA